MKVIGSRLQGLKRQHQNVVRIQTPWKDCDFPQRNEDLILSVSLSHQRRLPIQLPDNILKVIMQFHSQSGPCSTLACSIHCSDFVYRMGDLSTQLFISSHLKILITLLKLSRFLDYTTLNNLKDKDTVGTAGYH